MEMRLQWNELNIGQKTLLYMNHVKVPINKEAVFSDNTESYCSPEEPKPGEDVRIRCRTETDNVEKVYLRYGDERVEMRTVATEGVFDYHEAVITMPEESIHYYFELNQDGVTYYYNHRGVDVGWDERYNFKVIPGFFIPDWAKGAVMYQIYVDRFHNGNPANDVVNGEYAYIQEPVRKVGDWYEYPAAMDVRRFYGGDLEGVRQKLDYLQDLGVEVIYFNPLFVSPSNHKYDIQDYDYIDPHFGVIVRDGGEPLNGGELANKHASQYIARVTDRENLEASNQMFAELVEEIHARGMKVILDGVFNHCGSFNKWLDREGLYEQREDYDKGAYVDKGSPYRTFFKFWEDKWPYNPTYDGWWGLNTLPKLNYEESPILYQYILDVGRKWVSPPFNADGWRLDVAADLGQSSEFNHQFWKDFRKSVKEANPNAIILAEHYGDPEPWLRGDEWDTVMNYDAFMEPVTWFFTGMEKHSDGFQQDLLGNADAFFAAMRENMMKYTQSSLQTTMNELSNHDHSRFLTRTNRTIGRTNGRGPEAACAGVQKSILRAAVIVQMTWPGAPTVYYGDEAGLCGWTDPDNRRTYPWGREDSQLIDFHREVIRIHKECPVLRRGSILFLAGEPYFISYGRFDGRECVIVAVNSSGVEKSVEVPAWKIGMANEGTMTRLLLSHEHGFTLEGDVQTVEKGRMRMVLPPFSGVVYKG